MPKEQNRNEWCSGRCKLDVCLTFGLHLCLACGAAQSRFFHIVIDLAALLGSKRASTIANSCKSQASEKEAT
jgi:hypothetical protein